MDEQCQKPASTTNINEKFFDFFGLRENPFSANQDPRYSFSTRMVKQAWAELTCGIQTRNAFAVLTGEAGTGKTRLVRQLAEWLRQRETPTAFIFNPQLHTDDLFEFMLADFGIPPGERRGTKPLMCLNNWLFARYRAGRTAVLIVDEAQGLSTEVLESIRLLLNLETAQEKLLQIVLSGQPELNDKLNRPELRQLRQRITLRSWTRPLTLDETHSLHPAQAAHCRSWKRIHSLARGGECGIRVFARSAARVESSLRECAYRWVCEGDQAGAGRGCRRGRSQVSAG